MKLGSQHPLDGANLLLQEVFPESKRAVFLVQTGMFSGSIHRSLCHAQEEKREPPPKTSLRKVSLIEPAEGTRIGPHFPGTLRGLAGPGLTELGEGPSGHFFIFY